MINIVSGLSKSQVKAIVKITSSKELIGRTPLQGLCYRESDKIWYCTDGYVASVWHMNDKGEDTIELREDSLPACDVIVPYQKLKAWLANAKAKDVLVWADLVSMCEEEKSVDMLSVMGDDGPADHAYIDPKRLAMLLPLFEYYTDFKYVKRGAHEQALKIELVNSNGYLSPKQVGMVMGMRR